MQVSLKDGLFTFPEGAKPARLLGGRCPSCARFNFPAQGICPYCSAPGCETVPLIAEGVLRLCTTVHKHPPGYEGPVPFGFGVVELSEGIQIISRISDPDLPPGTEVRLILERLFTDAEGRDVVTYAFKAVDSRESTVDTENQSVDTRQSTIWTESRESAPLTHDSGLRTQDSALSPRPSARPVYIAGVGLHPFGRFEGMSTVDLGTAAVRMALTEAGCERGGFQAAYCGTVYSGVAAGHKVLTAIGLTGMPIVNVETGCASGAAALSLGLSAISSGQYDRVLVFGMEKMPRGLIRSSFFEPWREQAGLAVTPAYFALRAQRLMRDSGVTLEHLAQVSVKNHGNGVHNPYAMFRKEFSLQAVLSSPLVCEPLRLYMMCSPNEGAAAMVLSAAPAGGERPVRVAAAALRSHLAGNVLGEHTPLSGLVVDSDIPSPTRLAASEAYETAGIAPGDIDVAEVQDTDAARELLSYEELGLCPPGAAGQWIAERRTEMTGALPVNPSGGLLSKGEPLGASGLAQVVELYWQLRGRAERRQVPAAKVALAHTVGRGANAAVVLLTR